MTLLKNISSASLHLFLGSSVNASSLFHNITEFGVVLNITSSSILHAPRSGWYLSLLLVLTITTILSNFLVILSFCIDSRIRTPFNYYLLNIAICDLLVGAISLPHYTIYFYYDTWPLSSWQCALFMYFDYTAGAASLWGLVVVSINRMLAVTFPIFYREHHSNKTCFCAVIASWLIVNASTLPGFIYTRYYFSNQVGQCIWESDGLPTWASSLYTSVVINGWLPTIIAVFCYGITISKLFQPKVQNMDTSATSPFALRTGSTRRRQKERQAFLVLTLLLGALIVFWMPWYVFSVRKLVMKKEDPQAFEEAAVWMTYALSAVNPFLFNVANNDIKAAISRRLCERSNRTNGLNSIVRETRGKSTGYP